MNSACWTPVREREVASTRKATATTPPDGTTRPSPARAVEPQATVGASRQTRTSAGTDAATSAMRMSAGPTFWTTTCTSCGRSSWSFAMPVRSETFIRSAVAGARAAVTLTVRNSYAGEPATPSRRTTWVGSARSATRWMETDHRVRSPRDSSSATDTRSAGGACAVTSARAPGTVERKTRSARTVSPGRTTTSAGTSCTSVTGAAGAASAASGATNSDRIPARAQRPDLTAHDRKAPPHLALIRPQRFPHDTPW